jgi:hypothetical protein
MPTQQDSPAPATVAVNGTSKKLLQLLRKRIRQLLRVTFVLALCLVLGASAFAIWWLISLSGLPDIGDPFDVAAFRAFRVPDDENALRVLRLLFANYLAHVEVPTLRRRKPTLLAALDRSNRKKSVPIYPVSPEAPAGAHALPPHDVARWLATTRDAKFLLDDWDWQSVRLDELKAHRNLVITLAEELYRRERGNLPPAEEALVGTYLTSLPDDSLADQADEMTPKVE